MIKYCSTLYAGHVLEGDGIGFDGKSAKGASVTQFTAQLSVFAQEVMPTFKARTGAAHRSTAAP